MLYKICTLNLLALLAIPTINQADNYDMKDYVEMFEMGAKGLHHMVLAVNQAKKMSTRDLDQALHNLNNITWDIVLPVLAGFYAATNYHMGRSKSTKFITGTGSAVGACLAAYVAGSVPKEVINKLISKATGIKHSIEDTIAA